MSVFQEKVFVQSLPQWLEIATKDLTAPAKKRIRQEIEAHFIAAVESQMERGLDEVEARKQALAELGDAQTAAKRFRRQHLTLDDLSELNKVLKRCRSGLYILLCLPIIVGWGLILARSDHSVLGFPIYGATFALVITTIAFCAAWRKATKRTLHLLTLLDMFLAIYLPLSFSFFLWPANQHDWASYLLAILITTNGVLNFPLWFKLQTNRFTKHLPPQNGAVA